jgi:cobalt-zinc-cadmium efflux system outer membrane protein
VVYPLHGNAIVHAVMLGIASMTGVALPAKAQNRGASAVLTLREVFDSVGARHPLVLAARARARAARGARATAGTLGNPMLAYQVESRQMQSGHASQMEREAMTTATLPLEVLYQRPPRVRRADAEVRAAEADVSAQQQRVALEAAHAYYRTAVAQVGLEVARDLAAWLDTVVAYNRARAREGVAAEGDLIRSELERDRAAADVAMQEADLARARSDLAAFVGDLRSGIIEWPVAAGEAPLVLPVGASRPLVSSSTAGNARLVTSGVQGVDADTLKLALTSRALGARPEVRAARERLAAAHAGLTSERTMIVRQLGATVGTMQSGGATSLVAGVSLPFPLFDQNRGEIARATAEREAAMFELAAQERAVRAEVAGAYEAARLLTERAEALSQRSHGYLARADEVRRIALGAYREGAVPLIQVIDAARAWGEALLAYYHTLYAQHESVLEFIAAQGGDVVAALPSLTRSGGGDGSGGPAR